MSKSAHELQAVLDTLKHGSPAQRRTAAFKLGAMNNPMTVPELIAAAGDPDTGVRAFIASALATLGPAAQEAVRTALQDRNPLVRQTAARALAHMHDPAAAADLIPLLDDPDGEVQAAAAAALRAYDTPAAKEALAAWQARQG